MCFQRICCFNAETQKASESFFRSFFAAVYEVFLCINKSENNSQRIERNKCPEQRICEIKLIAYDRIDKHTGYKRRHRAADIRPVRRAQKPEKYALHLGERCSVCTKNTKVKLYPSALEKYRRNFGYFSIIPSNVRPFEKRPMRYETEMHIAVPTVFIAMATGSSKMSAQPMRITAYGMHEQPLNAKSARITSAARGLLSFTAAMI